MTLSIGKYCAGAGFGVRGVAVVVMWFPDVRWSLTCSAVSEGSMRGGGGQPLSSRTGLCSNVVDATPHGCGPRRRVSATSGCSVAIAVPVTGRRGGLVEDEAVAVVCLGSGVGGLGVEFPVGSVGCNRVREGRRWPG